MLPPLALPRFMPHGLLSNLHFGVEPITASAAGVQSAIPVEAVMVPAVTEGIAALPAAEVVTSTSVDPGLLAQMPWMTLGLAVWLGGAVLFIAWRTITYRWMRRDLLDGARVIAHSDTVRIVETSAITAPLAFGVFDKVVALPQGFLADADSETSDFAIAHEMEHHAGGDLLALIVMQPLFALHWFNPIGWAGWRAVRADQEAFCDARVMAGRTRAERARYGRLIASMAGGTRLGLAAPMAGPLSGEKPIIQRLKALAAADVSPTRRLLARSLFALAIVAVPATATVSYAAMDEAEADPVPPQAHHSAMPYAPQPPVPPEAPEALAEGDLPEPPRRPSRRKCRMSIWRKASRRRCRRFLPHLRLPRRPLHSRRTGASSDAERPGHDAQDDDDRRCSPDARPLAQRGGCPAQRGRCTAPFDGSTAHGRRSLGARAQGGGIGLGRWQAAYHSHRAEGRLARFCPDRGARRELPRRQPPPRGEPRRQRV
ncbi:M56 family metallopeptidase [Novosphingobium resinovorum]